MLTVANPLDMKTTKSKQDPCLVKNTSKQVSSLNSSKLKNSKKMLQVTIHSTSDEGNIQL